MDIRYDLIFEGKISDDCSPADARRNLAKLLRRESGEIEALFSGKPFFLRRTLDPETAYRLRRAMKHAGLVCRLIPTNEVISVIGEQPTPAITPAPIAPAPPAVFSECPKCRYRARGTQDGLIFRGVYPTCGLIIANYLQLQAEKNRPEAPVHSASTTSNPTQSNDLEFEEPPNSLLKFMSLEFTPPTDIALPDHHASMLLPTLLQKERMRRFKVQLTAEGFEIGPLQGDSWPVATERSYQGTRSTS